MIPNFKFRARYCIYKKSVNICVLNKIYPTFSRTWFSTFFQCPPLDYTLLP